MIYTASPGCSMVITFRPASNTRRCARCATQSSCVCVRPSNNLMYDSQLRVSSFLKSTILSIFYFHCPLSLWERGTDDDFCNKTDTLPPLLLGEAAEGVGVRSISNPSYAATESANRLFAVNSIPA